MKNLIAGNNPAVERELDRLAEMHGGQQPAIVENRMAKESRKLKEAIEEARLEINHFSMEWAEKQNANREMFQAAAEEVSRLVQEEESRIDAELEREKRRLERDREINRSKYEAESRAAALRYSAMTAGELEEEASAIMKNPKDYSPEVLDLLSAELRRTDEATHSLFRDSIKKNRLYETHRWTETGRRLADYRSKLGQFQDGRAIPVLYEDGTVVSLPLSDLVGE